MREGKKCPGSGDTAGAGWADAASVGVGAMLLSLFGGNRGGSQAQGDDDRCGEKQEAGDGKDAKRAAGVKDKAADCGTRRNGKLETGDQ